MISHKRLAHWYLQLAQHLEAGTPMAPALRLSKGPPQRHRDRMADELDDGRSLHQVLETAPRWLPRADRIFLAASEQTGRLPQTLSTLMDRHERIGATQMKAIMGLVYPLGVFHVAALVLPLVRMIDFDRGFEWDMQQHLLMTSALLLPVWALCIFITLLAKTEKPLLPRLLRLIPLLRRYSRAQSLADFSYALGTFIETGIPIQAAWKHAVRIGRDNRLNTAYRRIEPILKDGKEPAEILNQFKVFPPDFVAFYQSGALTGQLDSNLIKAGQRYQLQANQAMTFAAIVYPTLLFALVAAFIIFSIFKVYGGYVDMLMDIAS
ncbi:MAG: type II secretion system F family protein [Opitutales bacterium]|jgi:type II secretory pathway component PulF|nr:type II secretion system F family protein [Opitutales bacterium]MDP4643508.1 type II secretion system F family protein [Opitutales bacterium]MDP4778129.1 type II secretion system F family protein [Opitutales bacterium]MDP4880174.1 type II secretion system F family protein [Opitutales bacterium]MDP4883216.1 type II secretion system F family protein [Opitutales bacterium]